MEALVGCPYMPPPCILFPSPPTSTRHHYLDSSHSSAWLCAVVLRHQCSKKQQQTTNSLTLWSGWLRSYNPAARQEGRGSKATEGKPKTHIFNVLDGYVYTAAPFRSNGRYSGITSPVSTLQAVISTLCPAGGRLTPTLVTPIVRGVRAVGGSGL